MDASIVKCQILEISTSGNHTFSPELQGADSNRHFAEQNLCQNEVGFKE